jgi:hypothetical protein
MSEVLTEASINRAQLTGIFLKSYLGILEMTIPRSKISWLANQPLKGSKADNRVG